MQLLKLLKELTIHPQNAEELKVLILQLAIQGKLTKKWREQNPDVEPASLLLEKIKAEKEKLIKEKKIKKEKFSPIKSADYYFNIPDNWFWSRLGEIGFVFNGNSVNKGIKEAKYTNLKSGYPYIATKDVGYIFEQIDHDNGVKIPFKEPKFKVAKKGTVLICSEGGSAGKKMGITDEDCCFGNKLFAIHQFGKIEPLYILALYGSKSFNNVFKESMTGIIGGISRNNFANLIIPLPPLEEQKAIVAIVNQLFKEVDQLEDQTKEHVKLKEDFVTSSLKQLTEAKNINGEWKYLQQHFKPFFNTKESVKKLRETILQLAVQGKLTHHWRTENPDIEPASVLLEKIKTEKEKLIKEKKIKKEKPLPEISDDEVPYEIPESWEWCMLGTITILITDGKHGNCRDEDNSGYYFLSAKDVQKGKLLYENARQINYTEFSEVHSRTDLKAGDLCIVNTGATVGKTAIATDRPETNRSTFQKSVAVVKVLHHFFDIHYLENFIKVETPRLLKKSGGSAINNLLLGDMKRIKTPLPPLKEQKATVDKVNSLMTLCDQLEQNIEQNTKQVENLMQSCLKAVFEN